MTATFPYCVREILEWRVGVKARATARKLSGISSIGSLWKAMTSYGTMLEKGTNIVRELVRNEEPKKIISRAKVDNLPVVYLSCYWNDREGYSRTDNVREPTGLLVLDFDNVLCPGETIAKVWEGMPEAVFCALSAGGRGVWAAVCVDPGNWNGSVMAAFSRCMELGLPFDETCSDITRARYAAHSVQWNIIRDGDYYPAMFSARSVSDSSEMPSLVEDMIDGFEPLPVKPSKNAVSVWIDEHLKRITDAVDGTKDDTGTQVIGHLKRLCETYDWLDKNTIVERFIATCDDADFDGQKTRSKVRRLWK